MNRWTIILVVGFIVNLSFFTNEEIILTTVEQEEQHKVLSDALLEKNIEVAFQELVNMEHEQSLIPVGTKVNRVVYLDQNLYVDFSSEIVNYGGTMWEEYLTEILLDTAFQFEEVQTFTVAIDGEIKNFVEGTKINMYTRIKWIERKNEYE